MQACSSGLPSPPPPPPAAGGVTGNGNQVQYVVLDNIPPEVSDYELMEEHFRPRYSHLSSLAVLVLINDGNCAVVRRNDNACSPEFVIQSYVGMLKLFGILRLFNSESSQTRGRGRGSGNQRGWGIRDPNRLQEPRFVGVKRHHTYRHEATDYGITVYELVNDNNRIQKGVVLCRVSEDSLADPSHGAENNWPLEPNHAPENSSVHPENDDFSIDIEQFLAFSPAENTEGATVYLPTYTRHGEGPSTATASGNERPWKKKQHARPTSDVSISKTTSEVWKHFTKIFDGDEEVLAACHRCNVLLSGSSTNGTTHLWRHKATCPAQC